MTGASRGFGLAVARELAAHGWHLVIDARDENDLELATKELDDIGAGSATGFAGSVTDLQHVADLVAHATLKGDFRLLVNNASILGPSPQPHLDVYPIDVLREVFEVNLLGPLRLIQGSLLALRRSKGAIVNITSDAAVETYEGWGGYGSSKAALEQLSSVLAAEEPEVSIYWFDPGDMNTRMHQEAFPGEDISDRPMPEDRVPGLIRLLDASFRSGRYAASDLLEPAS